jgi:hypothetical protein
MLNQPTVSAKPQGREGPGWGDQEDPWFEVGCDSPALAWVSVALIMTDDMYPLKAMQVAHNGSFWG